MKRPEKRPVYDKRCKGESIPEDACVGSAFNAGYNYSCDVWEKYADKLEYEREIWESNYISRTRQLVSLIASREEVE